MVVLAGEMYRNRTCGLKNVVVNNTEKSSRYKKVKKKVKVLAENVENVLVSNASTRYNIDDDEITTIHRYIIRRT